MKPALYSGVVSGGLVDVNRWRGAFCIPGFFPDGARLWTPATLAYPEGSWPALFTRYLARGYTHYVTLAYGWPYRRDYAYIEPDPARARRCLELQKAFGLVTVWAALFGSGDGPHWEHGGPILDRCADLIDVAFPMYEMNTDVYGRPVVDTVQGGRWVGGLTDCVAQLRSRLPARARIGIHMTPGHGALGSPEPDWWLYAGGVTGPRLVDVMLSQQDDFYDPERAGAGAETTAVRLLGIPPAPPAWFGLRPRGVLMVGFEQTASLSYRGYLTEAQQMDYTRRWLVQAPHAVGFCDGGPRL